MLNQIKKIAIVGGGTAGLIAALILKTRFPNFSIDIIHSKNIGIIGVGEGSTEHFRSFMEYVGISQYSIIKECDATYKMGIMFDNWTDSPYLHSLQTPYVQRFGDYNFLYSKLISEQARSEELSSSIYWNNQVNLNFLNKPTEFFSNQFHFNTFKLNNFLCDIAKSKGINFIDDEIQDVVLKYDGSIKNLKGLSNEYEYDFYIDSTGFKRILIEKLGAKWNSYRKYLKMNSAITFSTSDTENYNMWTVARAMDYGWLFRIPVWGRHGNGYIYDSDYITADQAHAEVEKLFNGKIDIGRSFQFDPGSLDKVWIKNCCAIGLSGSFVEPLEASSIGTSIQQSFLLVNKLINYDENIINDYNKSFNSIMNNIRDFIVLHYLTKKNNTKFWTDISKIEIPDSLKSKLEIWKNKLPIKEDFKELSDYILFSEDNFAIVMHGLGMFNHHAIKAEFDSLPTEIKNNADRILLEEFNYINSIKTISHKEYLALIRNIL
jgi:flavin-dependent dehydrogenase